VALRDRPLPSRSGHPRRLSEGEFGRSKLVKADEAVATALQLPDASHHARATRSIRLVDVGYDNLAVGRPGDALGDASGWQRGALVGVERIAGNAEA